MSKSQLRINTTKQGDYPTRARHFAILIGLGLLGYYGYCFGVWGRNSLFLQYLFQCNCPSFSEEWRYPRQVDVIVSACRYAGSILSPTGNLLYVWEGKSRFADTFSSTYLLDFHTNEKIPFFVGKGSNSFLTDDLLFLSLEYGHDDYEGGEYILDRTTGTQYPIRSVVFLQKDAYVYGKPNLNVLARELRNAQDIYLIDNKTIVALKSDFETHPENSFYFDTTSLPGSYPNQDEQFLQSNGLNYQAIPELFQEEALSPNGKFIARADGIYLAESGEKIVEPYTAKGITGKYFSVRGWTYDSRGVIYYKFLDGCLPGLPSFGTCFITVPQPLIKLKVPEEYLSSAQTP